MSRKERDRITEFSEWQEQNYNPSSAQKYSHLLMPRRSSGFWIFALIDVCMVIPAFLFFVVCYFLGPSSGYLILAILLGGVSVLALLRMMRLKPTDQNRRTQEEMDKIRRKENKEKKVYPKMPKNYK